MSETAAATERRYLSYLLAAEYRGVSAASLRRAVEARRLRTYRPSPGRVVFDRAELDRWVRGDESHGDSDTSDGGNRDDS